MEIVIMFNSGSYQVSRTTMATKPTLEQINEVFEKNETYTGESFWMVVEGPKISNRYCRENGEIVMYMEHLTY